jgi:hypothetical protein
MINMSESKLMKPLFIDGMFNREGKRIRAKYIKTISDGNVTYPLWIESGKPNKDYTKNPDDKYYLYIQVGEWLIMTGYTEYELETRSGSERLNKEWYGSFEKREEYFDENIYKGHTSEEYEPLVKEQIEKESVFIVEYGKDEATQVAFLKKDVDCHIARYIDARDNNGKFADFVGAAFVGELKKCDELSQNLEKIRQQKENIKRAEREEQHKKDVEEERKKEQAAIKEAENTFINGGTIKNGALIVKIADKYGIDVPIRTRGWILNTLAECTISESGSVSYRYWKRSKGAKGSQKVYDVLSVIIRAIKEARAA